MSVLVIGSSNLDIFCHVERIPQIGETVLGKSISYKFGGKGANQVVTLAKMGSKVTFLTCLGKDRGGKSIVENLKNVEVDTSHIEFIDDISTGTAIINVDENGSNNIVVIKGANDYCDKEYVLKHEYLFEIHDYILLQLEIPIEAVEESIRLAKKYNKSVILNPAPANSINRDLYSCIDYLTPNETELEILAYGNFKSRDIEDSAKVLLDAGIKNLIVTLGEKGVMYFGNRGKFLVKANKVKTIDTVGAGDCFNGAFISFLEKGKSVNESIEFANLAASISVTKSGAQESIPSLEEVKNLQRRINGEEKDNN